MSETASTTMSCPPQHAGLVPIHIIRGAWGYIQRDWPGIALARAQVRNLSELPELLSPS